MDREVEPFELVALAGEMEKEGQYNAAKLLRAASASLLTRRAFEEGGAVPVAGFADALRRVAAQLEATEASVLAGPLRSAAQSIAAGGVPLEVQAPDPLVCRVCGAVLLEGGRDRCPGCGRWTAAAERFRPIYWLRESYPPEAVTRLRTTPGEIAGLLEGIPAEVLLSPPAEAEWSAHQTLQHLHNAQGVFRGRIDQLLAGGEPTLQSVMVWTMGGDEPSTGELFDRYRELRAEIVEVLERAEPEAWWNRGFHEEWGWVTLAEQASYFANHEPTHLAQIADAIA